MKKVLITGMLAFSLFTSVAPVTHAYATGVSIDSITQDNSNSRNSSRDTDDYEEEESSRSAGKSKSSSSADAESYKNNSIQSYMKGYKPITDQNMEDASHFANPLTSKIGTLSGIVLMLTMAGIFLVTAVDLIYIYIPPLRGLLGGGQQQSSGGGMGMGMGMSSQSQSSGGWKLVSDDALQAVASGGSQSSGGGMGMGMGMSSQPQSKKNVAFAYLKTRVISLTVFGICSVLLFSSLFTDFGMDVGGMVIHFVTSLMSQMTEMF